MLNTATTQPLADALAESLMTMAFLDAFPSGEVAAPQDALVVRLAFTGSRWGAMEVVTSEALGAALAANMLGTTPDDPDASQRGRDALKELVNVTCGLLLSRLPDAKKPAMGIPCVREADVRRWEAFARRSDVAVLDVEGMPLAVRLRGVSL